MWKKRKLTFYIKLLSSALLLYYVFQKVGWEALWHEMRQADVFFLSLYIALGVLATLVSATKWLILSKSHGIPASLPQLFTLYMVGYFFNHVLPTSVGGDVIRGYELGKVGGKKAEAMASVFMERFTGLTTLILFALIAVSLNSRFLTDVKLVLALGIAFTGYIGVSLLIFNIPLVNSIEKRIPIKILKMFFKKIQKIQESIYIYRDHKKDIMYAMGYSVIFYVVTVFIVYVGCLAFDTHVSIKDLFMAVPLMLVLFMIPISIGGIGLQEWAYYFVLGMVGVPSAVGLSLGLLYRARAVGFGLLGGVIYPFVSKGVPSRNDGPLEVITPD